MNNNLVFILLCGIILPLAPSQGVGQGHDHDQAAHGHGDERTTQITVWTDRFEIFAEHPFVVAGVPAAFVTHVTILESHAPRTQGPVTFVLRKGAERVEYKEPAPKRNGIYIPELVFPTPGTWSLSLHIPDRGRDVVIDLRAVQVYADPAQAGLAPDPIEPEGISFLKEQAWITPFAVERVKPRMIDGTTYWVVPESALALADSRSFVFVQLAGETFEQRPVNVKSRSGGLIVIDQGLSAEDHVVTLGAAGVALAQGAVAAHVPGDPSLGQVVHVSDEQMRLLGIEYQAPEPGSLDSWIQAPGEIKMNHDRMAHIVPRVKGVVDQVYAHLGDHVKAGQILAVIESRELADAKAAYLGAQERLELVQAVFTREERLLQQKVSSEQEYLAAKQALAEARIQHRTICQKLLALGLSTEDIERLPEEPAERFTSYRMKAPFNGTIIKKHIVLGEVVDDTSEVFVIADLATVWVDLLVNQRDIASVEVGQPVIVCPDGDNHGISGKVNYVDLVIEPTTRVAVVRTVLDNTEARYRPGVFVSGRIRIKQTDQGVVVPADSVQMIDDQPCVFVKIADGFALRPVTTGLANKTRVEIAGGLNADDQVITKNAFHLKAELAKQADGGAAGHGHVH